MAFTKSQLEALTNTLLASNQPILASQHRQQIQSIIDEMYDAQSRGNILVGVQSDTVQGGSDTFLVFRSGQAYQLPVSLLNANDLASLGDVFINNLEDGETLVYDAIAGRWENRNISLGFAISNLSDVQLTSLSGGDILRYDSVDNIWENVSLASLLAPYVTIATNQTITGQKTFNNLALQLASVGSSQPTVLRNTGAGAISTIGFNSLGFNTNRHLFFNDGTSSNICILAYNNTEQRTYTLQNNNGTLAFTSDITDAISSYQLLSEKGQPNGYASLDTGGKVPLSQINDAILGQVSYQGTWNATTNTPTLANPPSSATKGNYYVVSVGGTFAGITFEVGDWIISNGTAWEKVNNTDAVRTVFGRLGDVVANANDYASFYVTLNTNQTITGQKTFNNTLRIDGQTSDTYACLAFKQANGGLVGVNGYTSIHPQGSNLLAFRYSQSSGARKEFRFDVQTLTDNTIRVYTMPNASGTIALTSDLNAYVTLATGQTIAGNKTFNIRTLRLAGSGTSLPTIITNTEGEYEVTGGFNSFGFNNSQNIYFSKLGSNANVGILSFNNTEPRTYTLPNASGNIVLGTLESGQVAFGTGSNAIGGDIGLTWDNTNKRLGINTTFNVANAPLRVTNNNAVALAININSTTTDDYSAISWNGSTISLGGLTSQSVAIVGYRAGAGAIGRLGFWTRSENTNTERWTIESNGILQSNGAQTIKTSTGNLTLATAGGNGNILLMPNGSGNVGIGTSSPGELLSLIKSSKYQLELSHNTTTDGDTALIRFRNSTNVGLYSAYIGTVRENLGVGNGSIIFGTNPVASNITDSILERMRITSSGDIGIGTTSPNSKLTVTSTATSIFTYTQDLHGTANSNVYPLRLRNTIASSEVGILFDRTDSDGTSSGWGISVASGGTTIPAFLGGGHELIFRDRALEGPAWHWVMNRNYLVGNGSSVIQCDDELSLYGVGLTRFPGKVAIGTTSPAASAILDISSTTGALLLPRMTTTQRDALTAVNGMVLYNTTTNTIQGRVNGSWTNL